MAKQRKPNVFKISNEEVLRLSNAFTYPFPKYTTQIINLANGNAQGTVPRVVGQLTDFIQEFDGQTLEEWIAWYDNKMPDAIEIATEKAFDMVVKMREVSLLIDKDMVRHWVKDVAGVVGQEWRLATKAEEAKNIDGYIGEVAVQIKSSTYKLEKRLNHEIDIPIIYYEKKSNGLEIELDGFDITLF